MYANLGPGQMAALDPVSSTGFDLLYSHKYVAKRMKEDRTQDITKRARKDAQRLNLYAYTLNNPVIYVDPSGLLCKVTVHCWEVYRWPSDPSGRHLGRHCGLTIETDKGATTLDGSGGTTGQILVNGSGPWWTETFDPVIFADSYCDCLLGYPPIFNAAKLPRTHTAGNSNWALNCLVTHCNMTINWGNWGPPSFYDNPPCKRSSSTLVPGTAMSVCNCEEYHSCP